jgi:endo-1,4-beta-xylanase
MKTAYKIRVIDLVMTFVVVTWHKALAVETLRSLATKRGIYIGAAVNEGVFSNPTYASILNDNFSLITAEYACKFGQIEPSRNSFDYS